MVKRILIIVALVALVISVMVVVVALQRPGQPPTVSVTFLAFTNDIVGTRLATFALSNLGASAIRRQSHYTIQTPTPMRWTNYAEGWVAGGTRILRAGASEAVSIPAPTNQPSWRVSLSVSLDVGVVRDMMDMVVVALRNLGFQTRYRKMNYGAEGDWIRE